MQFDIHTHRILAGNQSIYANSTHEISARPYSVGMHPWEFDESNFSKINWGSLLNHPNCVAIGEIGLDRMKGPDLQTQVQGFRIQVALSEQYDLPVIIHCVRAFEELIQLKRELDPNQYWIIHGFEKIVYLEKLIDSGFYISIGHRILKNEKLQTILPQIPVERLFLETDESRNSINTIYESVARLINLPLNQLENQIEENIKRVFPRWKIG